MRSLRSRATHVLALLLLLTLSCEEATGPDRVVVSVVVTGPSGPLAPTATRQLAAVAQRATGTAISGKEIAWSSYEPLVASVSSTGLVTAIAPGTTTIRAVSDGVQGDYGITVAYPTCSASTISGTISAGQTRTGVFSETGCQRFGIGPQAGWSITVATPTTMRFELSALAGQVSLAITNAAMEEFAFSISGEFPPRARVVTVLVPGTYYVWAGAGGSFAPYTLQATAVTLCGTPLPLTGPIAVDQTVAGALTTSSCLLPHVFEGQGWSFTLGGESPVKFDVIAVGFTPWIVVTDVELDVIAVGAPTSATEASLAELLPAGEHQVWITTSGGGLGTFTLTRSVATITACEDAAPVGVVAIGGSVNGIIASTDCRLTDGRAADPWSLTVPVGATLQVDLASSDFDTFLYVLDASGAVIDGDDDSGDALNSRVTRAFAAGQYTLLVTSYSAGETGAYSLGVQQTAGLVAGAGAGPGGTGAGKSKPRPSWPLSPW